MPKPSEIVLIEFPFSDLISRKRRPALVVNGPSRYGDILALAMTSKPQYTDGVAITQAELVIGKLVKPSWVRCDQLHTFDQSLIRGHIGTLSPMAFESVRKQLCEFMGCRLPN